MPPKFKRKINLVFAKVKIPLFCLGLIGLMGVVGLTQIKGKPSFWWSVFLTNPLKQSDGRTNLLLLGISGGTHAGADLTDTMIFLSLSQKNGQTVLVSLPRDIWSQNLVAKINTAYHYGEEKEKGGGLILAKTTVEEIIDLPVHYTAKIDLAGLDDLIDLLGGVEVNVERTFDDYKFPIEGKENDPCNGDREYQCRYQHVRFEAGKQILNGEKALQYLRSRNAEGDEGTDFARSQRQERFILALKNKIFSPGFLLQPQKILQLISLLGKIIETDLPQEDFAYLIKMTLKTNFREIKTLSLEKFLINPPAWQYGQWVLIPRTEDFGEIQQYLKEQILN